MRTGNIGRDTYRDESDARVPLTERERELSSELDNAEPIYYLIRDILQAHRDLPTATAAAARLPRCLRGLLDIEEVCAASAWLKDFANACRLAEGKAPAAVEEADSIARLT